MDATLFVAPAQLVYAHIPAQTLRTWIDGLLPSLAHDRGADAVAGMWHRWKMGHDLFLDVPSVFANKGPLLGLHRVGHILLTDFPTKAGIPIPLFSESGLGKCLVDLGIPAGYLNISLTNGGIGLLAVRDGVTDLVNALHGTLLMNTATCLDTFGAGTVCLSLGVANENPFLVGAGAEKLMAGIVSAWKTLSIHIDPLSFFGSALSSALIGGALTYWLEEKKFDNVPLNAFRSAATGGLFAVNPFFGMGAILGVLSYRFGRALAHSTETSLRLAYSIDHDSCSRLFEALCIGDPGFSQFYNSAVTASLIPATDVPLPVDFRMIDSTAVELPTTLGLSPEFSKSPSLPCEPPQLDSSPPDFRF